MKNYTANDILEIMKNAKNYNRFLINTITDVIKYAKAKNILDFGCSDGYFIEKITEKTNDINIKGVEIDKTSFIKCQEKSLQVFENIDEINNLFDLIYSLNVLEHIEDDRNMIEKFYNKLNENGTLVLYVPALQFLYSSMDKKVGHYRRYSLKNLKEKIETGGFKIHKAKYCDSLGVLATLLYKLKDKFLNNNGNISVLEIKAYDAIFFISRVLDKILFKYFMGKNLIIIAKKI